MKKLWLLIPVLLLLSVTWGTADSEILPSGARASVAQEEPGAWLGVMIKATVKKTKDGDKESTESRVVIEDVVDGSPAEKAGIEDGDVLVAFNNVAIGEPKDLTGALKKLKEGDKATVTVERDGARKTFDVVLGAAKERKAIVQKSIRLPRPPRAPRAPMAGLAPGLSWVSEGSGTYGLKIETLGKQLGEYFGAPEGEGVLVKSVKEDSDAAKAGFKAGDVIVRAGKKTVEDVDDFRSVLGAYDAGEKIPVKVIRKGKEATIELTAKEEEEDGEHRIIMKNLGGGGSPRMFHFYSDEDMDEFDGLESDDFDIRFDVDADEFEDEVRQMRIMINGKELRLDELKEHMEELNEHMDELRENIEVEVDDNKVEIRTKKI